MNPVDVYDFAYEIIDGDTSRSVKIWNDLDIVSIAELQLLWEDTNTNQVLSSLRLYYLPEYTPEGRLDSHGEVGQVLSILYALVI